MDSPELRDLFLFLGTELEERDLPHRTKLSQMIVERFQMEFRKLLEEIQVRDSSIRFET